MSTQFESDYLLPFSKQEGFSDEKFSAFRKTAIAQCQEMATQTLFQGENVLFSERELTRFVSANGTDSMTDLVIDLVQNQKNWDKQVIALLQFKELLGNALLFFLHEQLRKAPRFQNTLAAFQREGLIIDLREVKNIVQSTESKLNQALSKKQFGEVAQLALTGDELRIKQMSFWSIVMLWNEHKRYEDPANANQDDSDSMIEATKNLVEDLCKISL